MAATARSVPPAGIKNRGRTPARSLDATRLKPFQGPAHELLEACLIVWRRRSEFVKGSPDDDHNAGQHGHGR